MRLGKEKSRCLGRRRKQTALKSSGAVKEGPAGGRLATRKLQGIENECALGSTDGGETLMRRDAADFDR